MAGGNKKTVQVKEDVAEIEARSSDEEMRRFGLNRESTIQGMCDSLDYGRDLRIEVTSRYMDSTRADVSFLLDLSYFGQAEGPLYTPSHPFLFEAIG